MQITTHFLNTPLFLWIGPRIITPIMPERMGLPPTAPTAMGRSSPPNQGSMRKESTTERPLKMPKQQPKARSMKRQSLLAKSLGMATLKGCFGFATESEGGVGGVDCWKMMLRVQQKQPMMASINIVLNARSLPSYRLSGLGLYPSKTKPGMKMPSTKETLRIRVKNWVTPPLVSAVNQFEDILVWQFKMKGLPIPAMTCPAMASQKCSLMKSRSVTPIMHRTHPIDIPTLDPQVSMKYAAGKVKMGCMSTKRSPAMLTVTGSSWQIYERQAAIGVKVLTRIAVIIWIRVY